MSFEKNIYITTPIYYVNAIPHLGHTYTTTVADVMSRHYRQRGKNVKFCTGTDEHGEKIAQVAAKNHISPLEWANGVATKFQSAWNELGLEYDIFYRSTLKSHYETVQNALSYLQKKGDIYFATYEGKYCLGCERFRTETEWTADGKCPDHLTEGEHRKESNYWFKMGSYQKQLIEFYKTHPETIEPRSYLNEVMSFLEQPLEDLCISRPTSRTTWGIPLPFDPQYVTYVWFDALLNYPAAIGYSGKGPDTTGLQTELWDNVVHLIGKDILKTHAIYWPTMLFALGLKNFSRLQVGGFWLTQGIKMSKSLGNVVDPLTINEKFGFEALRYYLMREMSFGSDASFTWESFINRTNADLANGIGNLASRVLTLVHKNLGAKFPSRAQRNADDLAFLKRLESFPDDFSRQFDECRFHLAIAAWSTVVADTDKYINDNKPWALAKDPAQVERLAAVLGTAMDALNVLSVVMNSFLPKGSVALRTALGWSNAKIVSWSAANTKIVEGQVLGEIPRLYPRLELPKDET